MVVDLIILVIIVGLILGGGWLIYEATIGYWLENRR
jgi:hypothetical protein